MLIEKTALLRAMHAIIGGVKIEDQFLGRLAKDGDEPLHTDLTHGLRTLTVSPLFEPTENWAGGEGVVPMDRSLQERIVAQSVVSLRTS